MSVAPVGGAPAPLEVDDGSRVREKPEEPGKLDQAAQLLSSGTLKGRLFGLALIGLAVFVILVILPGVLQTNIYSPKISFNNLMLFIGISLIAAVGIFGTMAGATKNKMLRLILGILSVVVPIFVAGTSIWWGATTLKTLWEQGNFLTGPFLFSLLGIGGGSLYLAALFGPRRG